MTTRNGIWEMTTNTNGGTCLVNMTANKIKVYRAFSWDKSYWIIVVAHPRIGIAFFSSWKEAWEFVSRVSRVS